MKALIKICWQGAFVIALVSLNFIIARNLSHDDYVCNNCNLNKKIISIKKQAENISQPASDIINAPSQNSAGGQIKESNQVLIKNVPFSAQAPLGEWNDPRQQDGCEEAASMISVYWALNKNFDPASAKKEILAIAEYEKEKYGSYADTSAQDTAERIIKGFFNYNKFEVREDISIKDIQNAIKKNSLVIVPTDGQKLGNPFYTPPGPERHNLVIIGYDLAKQEFITHDPGTKRGKEYRYNEKVLWEAINNYPTGNHIESSDNQKAMIIINK